MSISITTIVGCVSRRRLVTFPELYIVLDVSFASAALFCRYGHEIQPLRAEGSLDFRIGFAQSEDQRAFS
jgi:hypothetical protein